MQIPRVSHRHGSRLRCKAASSFSLPSHQTFPPWHTSSTFLFTTTPPSTRSPHIHRVHTPPVSTCDTLWALSLLLIVLHSLPPLWCLLHLPSVLLPLNMAHFPVQEFINSYQPQGRLQVHFWIFIQWIQLKCWTRTLHSSSNFCLSKEKGQIK